MSDSTSKKRAAGEIEFIGDAVTMEIGAGVTYGFTIATTGANVPRAVVEEAKRRAVPALLNVRVAIQEAAATIGSIPKLAPMHERYPEETFKLIAECHLDTRAALTVAIMYADRMELLARSGYCLCLYGAMFIKAVEHAGEALYDANLLEALVDAIASENDEERNGATRFLEDLAETARKRGEARVAGQRGPGKTAHAASVAAMPTSASPLPPSDPDADLSALAAAMHAADHPDTAAQRRRGLVS